MLESDNFKGKYGTSKREKIKKHPVSQFVWEFMFKPHFLQFLLFKKGKRKTRNATYYFFKKIVSILEKSKDTISRRLYEYVETYLPQISLCRQKMFDVDES